MKSLIVILGLVSFIKGHPVAQNGLIEDHIGQHILNHLSEMALSLDSSGIDPNLKTLPVSQLSSCITNDQRQLIKICISRSKCTLSSKDDHEGHASMESSDPGSHEEHSEENTSNNYSESQIRNLSHSLFPMVMKCIVDILNPVSVGEHKGIEVNVTNLKLSIIEPTSLSSVQKNTAGESFIECMSSNFTIPQHENEGNVTSLLVVQGDNTKTLHAVKVMLCGAKSVIMNGCADVAVSKPAAFTIVNDVEFGMESMGTTDENQENRTGVSDNKAEMAYPHDPNFHRDQEFLDMISRIAMYTKISEAVTADKALSCFPKDTRVQIQKQCHEKLVSQPRYKPHMTAECVAMDIAKAFNNETGIIDFNALKAAGIETTTLSVEQKKLASASLDSCMASDMGFSHPHPPPLGEKPKLDGNEKYGEGNDKHEDHPKYDHLNNPLRAMICWAKSLIENGCSTIKIA